jgi:uncharacterized Zn-binding protein involved in type VI secretion
MAAAQEERKGTTYAFATLAARTERGGYVTRATGGLSICGLRVALVGDLVTYGDGSQAAIIDGAGSLFAESGRCVALVGSRLSNGDRIVSAPWDGKKSGLFVRDGAAPAGLFDPSYVPPPVKAGYRFALLGSTTARGGVLREPSVVWRVDGEETRIGAIGDLVYYADGSTARITSGIALRANTGYAQFAYVGSALDNGDIITDSPEREGAAPADAYHPVTESQIARAVGVNA